MSFLDRVGNKVDNMKSKQSENSDISSFNKQIQTEKDAIDIAITKVGEYYWNLYANGDLNPPEEIASLFTDIETSVKNVNDLEQKIEARKAEGVEQRAQNDQATKEREEQKAAEAAERKKQREEAKRTASEEKAAEKLTKEE